MFKTDPHTSPIIAKAALRKRLYAFAITGLTVFVFTCLLWPLTVTGFRSVSAVNISGDMSGSEAELNNTFARLIRDETSNDSLDTIISQIESTGVMRSNRIEYRDHDWIRAALKVGLRSQASGCQFQLALDGEGGEDERQLVNILALRVAQRFGIDQQFNADQFVNHSSPTGGNETVAKANDLESIRAEQLSSFEEVNWLLTQIDNDLATLKTTGAEFSTRPTRLPSIQDRPSDVKTGTEFHFASSSKTISALDKSLQQTLDSIDTKSLRLVLNEIENRIRNQQVMVEEVDAFDVTEHGGKTFNVQSLNPSRTTPLHGIPSMGSLFLVGLFSALIGCAIARCYEPFEEKGFGTVESLSRMLGVPVVVELDSETESLINRGADSIKASWSNRIVKISGLSLLGMLTVVFGFILTNSEVRHAFFENPLYGCARIFRIFAGY